MLCHCHVRPKADERKRSLPLPSIIVEGEEHDREPEVHSASSERDQTTTARRSSATSTPGSQRRKLSSGSVSRSCQSSEQLDLLAEAAGEEVEEEKEKGDAPGGMDLPVPRRRRMLPGLSRSSPSILDEPSNAENDDEDSQMGDIESGAGGDRRADFDSDSRLDSSEPASLKGHSSKRNEVRPQSLLNLRDEELEPISLLLSSSRRGRSSTLTPSPSFSEVAWEASAGWLPQSPQPGKRPRLLLPSPPNSLRSTPCTSHAHLATPLSPNPGARSPRLARLTAFFKTKSAGVFCSVQASSA
ncbi:hypothetical protein PoB_006210000 [Plakobranchus ocellatus]|uniref:Uncharacterized protein n=1 Tax=Plakobranchus ocellatus TaxID=259542 RepID=A0AAV4CUN0_9GAST|nr:hypothetical protein PoB_006210000 [Plakobranchus ocellatus]